MKSTQVNDETPEGTGAHPSLKRQVYTSLWLRILCIILAWLCIVLAVIGIVLPGLPTVDFLLLAALFASKGSARLHGWLYQHRWFGPLLNQWGNLRTIPRARKIYISLSISLAAFIIFLSSLHIHLKLSCYGIFIVILCWVWTRSE